MRKIILPLLILLFVSPVFGQEWELKEKTAAYNGIGKVEVNKTREWGLQPVGYGSCTVYKKLEEVVYQGKKGNIVLCITATHVIRGMQNADTKSFDSRIDITFDDFTFEGAKVVAFNGASDLAILKAWVPSEINAIEVSSARMDEGAEVEICGYGGSQPLRIFDSLFKTYGTGKEVIVDADIIQGDSGGAVLHDKKLIGVISRAGYFRRYSRINNAQIGSPCIANECVRFIKNFENETPGNNDFHLKDTFTLDD